MNQRVKELRDLLNINQQDFAEKIGIKQGSLSDIERGKVNVSNANIILICRVFCVTENWLRYGIGEPFDHNYNKRESLLDLEKEILFKYNSLNSYDRRAIEQILNSLYQKSSIMNA